MIDLMKVGRHDWRVHWVERRPDGGEELHSERFVSKRKAIARLEELRLEVFGKTQKGDVLK